MVAWVSPKDRDLPLPEWLRCGCPTYCQHASTTPTSYYVERMTGREVTWKEGLGAKPWGPLPRDWGINRLVSPQKDSGQGTSSTWVNPLYSCLLVCLPRYPYRNRGAELPANQGSHTRCFATVCSLRPTAAYLGRVKCSFPHQ